MPLSIAVSATAAPLAVAIICAFTYRNMGGGRHLIYWAAAHAFLALPFALAGFADVAPRDLSFIPFSVSTAGLIFWAIALAAGIRVLCDREDHPRAVAFVAVGIFICVTLSQQISEAFRNSTPSLVSSAIVVYAATLLLIRKRSILYTAVGVLLLGRAILTMLFAVQLQQRLSMEGSFGAAVFINMLTGLGLMLIEFDNARKREIAAREDEHRSRLFSETLLDAMPATMTFKDRDLRYRVINRRMRELALSGLGDLIGRTWSEVVGKEAAAAVEREDLKILSNGQPSYMEQGWRGQDGRQIIIWAMKVPLREADGSISGVITCGIDITGLKDAEAQLIEQREAAESANRTKTAFLANMSHELRTPLNAIIGFSEMLAAGYTGSLSPRQQEYADSIRRSGQHLLQLVSDILDLSRLETGRLEVKPENCSLMAIAESALAMVKPQAARDGIALIGLSSDIPVHADPRALTQILVNLLGNAVKFTPAGGTVILDATADDRCCCITVRDTGIGMAEEEVRAAKAAFQRIDAYRSHGNSGAGLGLSICRNLIDMHGGHLEIHSQPGQGTVVSIYLPN